MSDFNFISIAKLKIGVIMKHFLFYSFSILASLVLISCASGPTITKVTSLIPLSDADKKVTKNGVTIEITPINATNEANYPELRAVAHITENGLFGPVQSEKVFPNVLCGLTFGMKITNNSGHIIRMLGSEVGVSVGGKDVKKLTKDKIGQIYVANGYQLAMGEINPVLYNVPYWDDALKILPGKTVQSFVAFDINLKEGIGQSTLSIYDLVTNSDNAGNPTERTNFDFNLQELTTQIQSK
jgi:hypothetical protein